MFRLGRICLLFLLLAPSVVPDVVQQAARAAEPAEDDPFVGRLLVATPSLNDPNFARTVVFLVHHDAGGAMGLVINRVLATGPLSVLLDGFGIDPDAGASNEIRVFAGGPVQQGEAFILHSTDYSASDTVPVDDDVALTRSLDVLRDMANGEGPRHAILALGYAGWGPGQLENELAQGAWDVVTADETLLFDDEVETKWQRARRRGIDL
jgi:putative transcriptional regulator